MNINKQKDYMDPKNNPEDNQSNQKEKVLPTYVFGEDYKQTVNLANKEKSQKEDTPIPEEKEDLVKRPKLSQEEEKELMSESVSAELEKMDLEKTKPITMIVNKKKFRMRFLVTMLFISALGLGSLYGVSMLLDKGIIGGAEKHSASGISMESLVCEMTANNSELLSTGNALESKSTVNVNYVNGEFTELVQTFEARFENYSTAKIALSNVRSNYVKRFKSFGIATEPFNSDYNQDGEKITVTHQADTSNINKGNAGIVHIDVNKNGVVIYDIDSIKKNYEGLGYTCSIQ